MSSPALDLTTLPDTPMMRQYRDIKQHYPNEILFFRLGDFYEMFLDDAKTASKELNITLTGRGKDERRVMMCGIPYHAAESYISKLVSKGYKVAICEQTEDADASPGITKRDVIKVITPATVMGVGVLEESDNNYLAAVIGPDKKGRYGVSYVDSSTGECHILSLETHDELVEKIAKINPTECLLPNDQNTIVPELDAAIHKSPYTPLDENRASERLCEFFKVKSLATFGIDKQELTYPAAWAIIDYLKTTQMTDVNQISRLQVEIVDNQLAIDAITCRHLELVKPVIPEQHKATLFWVLDKTKTAMGARQLKKRLYHPGSCPDQINKQLDAVESLVGDIVSREEIRESLTHVYDIERLITRIISHYHNPKDCLALKSSLKQLSEFPAILDQLEGDICVEMASFFKEYAKETSVYSTIIQRIEDSIRDDAPMVIRDGGIIKEGYSQELDDLTQSFKSIKTWIAGLESVEREKTGIKTLKVGFNKIFGYYFEIGHAHREKVPEHYIRKQTLTNAERYITPELKEKETLLLTGEDKQKKLEISLYSHVVDGLKSYVNDLQEVSRRIATLDYFQSLATVSHSNGYCRPSFSTQEEGVLEIIEGRHPVIEKNHAVHYIPNTIKLTREGTSFALITGPNMAGKSTVMRQVALTVIMAQMGCFVPAKRVNLSIVDKVFTRIGALDNGYVGQSTFMVEMVETASILHNATPNSLIVLDEIGRGTSTYDGLSIAQAVSEYIHDKVGARTLFATHYHELTDLSNEFDHIENYSMKITEQDDTIIFEYQLIKGAADRSYGVHVAQMAGMPPVIIKRATYLLKQFEREASHSQQNASRNQLHLFNE